MGEANDVVTYQAFQAFRPHFDTLATVGYFKLVPKPESYLKLALHNCYRIVLLIIVLTYNLQHFIKVIQVRDSTAQIVNTLFILLTTLNTLGKQLTFNLRNKRIDHIFDIISGPFFAPENSYHEEVMKSNAVVMKRLVRFYIGSVLLCSTLWTAFPLANRAMGVEVDFTAYFPFDTNNSTGFAIAISYMNIFIAFQAVGNVTMDCTIVAFYAQAKVQLHILRHNLEHLTSFNKVVETENSYSHLFIDEKDKEFGRLLHIKFVRCVYRHRIIKWFIKEIEDIFAEALFFQFFVTAWVICMTVYKIVGLNLLSVEFVSMAVYLGCMLAQFFIYCYYGTQVQYESEFLNQSIYCGPWLQLSPSLRRKLLIMMANCNRPITPRTAYVIPISLETYIAVLRASYTLFTFLDRK